MNYSDIKDKIERIIFNISAIGSADQELRSRISGEDVDWSEYEERLQNYRLSLIGFNTSRTLLYASLISSIASTFNIYGLGIIEQIASYIGASLTFVLYIVTRHIAGRRKELYRLEREMLVSKSQ